MSSPSTPAGAYGFRIDGVATNLLVAAPPDWPAIRIGQRVAAAGAPATLRIGRERATVPLIGGGSVSIRRRPAEATLVVAERLTDDELAHPYLGPIASIHAHWLGRQTFHGGGFMVGGRAWGLLGIRRAGKSTLLAEIARQGIPVLADDLLVIDRSTAFAGPRTIDLRRSAAEHFGAGRPLGVIGRRQRWRLDLAPTPPETPMGGCIFLRSGRRVTIEPISLPDRLSRLASSRMVRSGSADPAPLLRLAALPAIEVTAARGWPQLAATVEQVVEIIGQSEPPVFPDPGSTARPPGATPRT